MVWPSHVRNINFKQKMLQLFTLIESRMHAPRLPRLNVRARSTCPHIRATQKSSQPVNNKLDRLHVFLMIRCGVTFFWINHFYIQLRDYKNPIQSLTYWINSWKDGPLLSIASGRGYSFVPLVYCLVMLTFVPVFVRSNKPYYHLLFELCILCSSWLLNCVVLCHFCS